MDLTRAVLQDLHSLEYPSNLPTVLEQRTPATESNQMSDVSVPEDGMTRVST